MAESETQTMEDSTDDEKPEVIESTKTVVVAEDLHNSIRHIATDREVPIKNVVDEVLRADDEIQRYREFLDSQEEQDGDDE